MKIAGAVFIICLICLIENSICMRRMNRRHHLYDESVEPLEEEERRAVAFTPKKMAVNIGTPRKPSKIVVGQEKAKGFIKKLLPDKTKVELNGDGENRAKNLEDVAVKEVATNCDGSPGSKCLQCTCSCSEKHKPTEEPAQEPTEEQRADAQPLSAPEKKQLPVLVKKKILVKQPLQPKKFISLKSGNKKSKRVNLDSKQVDDYQDTKPEETTSKNNTENENPAVPVSEFVVQNAKGPLEVGASLIGAKVPLPPAPPSARRSRKRSWVKLGAIPPKTALAKRMNKKSLQPIFPKNKKNKHKVLTSKKRFNLGRAPEAATDEDFKSMEDEIADPKNSPEKYSWEDVAPADADKDVPPDIEDKNISPADFDSFEDHNNGTKASETNYQFDEENSIEKMDAPDAVNDDVPKASVEEEDYDSDDNFADFKADPASEEYAKPSQGNAKKKFLGILKSDSYEIQMKNADSDQLKHGYQHHFVPNEYTDLSRRLIQDVQTDNTKMTVQKLAEQFLPKELFKDSNAVETTITPEPLAVTEKVFDKSLSLRRGDIWNSVWKEEVERSILRNGGTSHYTMTNGDGTKPTLDVINVKIPKQSHLYNLVKELKNVSPKLLYIVHSKE